MLGHDVGIEEILYVGYRYGRRADAAKLDGFDREKRSRPCFISASRTLTEAFVEEKVIFRRPTKPP